MEKSVRRKRPSRFDPGEEIRVRLEPVDIALLVFVALVRCVKH